MTEEDLALIGRVREVYQELGPIPCTGCGYCMPCPNAVDIPYSFLRYNEGVMYEKENPRRTRFWYRWMAEGSEGEWFRKEQAHKCIQCRACAGKCPQGLPISDWLSVVHQVLGEGKPYPTHPQLARK